MIKTELEPIDDQEDTVDQTNTNSFLLGGSVFVVICLVVIVAFVLSRINNTPTTAPHSTISSTSGTLPLSSPSVSNLSNTGASKASPRLSQSSSSSLAAQSYNLQDNIPTAGKVNKPTTNSLQTSGPSNGQTINPNSPY